MLKTTKVFKSGNSWAVRLPKEFRLKEGEVHIKQEGNCIVLIPKSKKWDVIFEKLSKLNETEDFLKERNQPQLQDQDRELF
jgi:antitoxin VapB